MFEAAVGDGAQKFTLQQEVAETGGVDTDIASLLVGTAAGYSQVTLLVGIAIGGSRRSSGGWCCGGLKLLIRVVDEIFLVRHGDVNRRVLRSKVKLLGEGDDVGLK